MEVITITVEVNSELEQADRFSIEDAVYDALRNLDIDVAKVKVSF